MFTKIVGIVLAVYLVLDVFRTVFPTVSVPVLLQQFALVLPLLIAGGFIVIARKHGLMFLQVVSWIHLVFGVVRIGWDYLIDFPFVALVLNMWVFLFITLLSLLFGVALLSLRNVFGVVGLSLGIVHLLSSSMGIASYFWATGQSMLGVVFGTPILFLSLFNLGLTAWIMYTADSKNVVQTSTNP